ILGGLRREAEYLGVQSLDVLVMIAHGAGLWSAAARTQNFVPIRWHGGARRPGTWICVYNDALARWLRQIYHAAFGRLQGYAGNFHAWQMVTRAVIQRDRQGGRKLHKAVGFFGHGGKRSANQNFDIAPRR